MKVLEQTEVKLEWDDTVRLYEHPYPQHKRTKSTTHLTDVLRKVAERTNQFKPEDVEDEMPLRVFLGMAWEQMAVRLYDPATLNWQPGEVERDGIVGSPDGISTDIHPLGFITDLVVEEFKYTAKSARMPGGEPDSNRDITREWMWMNQVMGYCNMLDTDLARLHVCYARGNYVHPMEERYVRYLIRFEERELVGNWNMITKYAKGVRYGTI